MVSQAEFTTEAWDQRMALSGDLYRPLYHLLAPAKSMGDPNGGINRDGKYHFFYQYNPGWPDGGKAHWGHVESVDLVYWKDLPVGLAPTPGGPDERGCFSGGAVTDDGVATLVYWGVGRGMCVATSLDMVSWRKSSHNPVIPEPSKGSEVWRTHDPCVWREDETWYMVSGSQQGDPRGIGTSKDAAYLFESHDLVSWDYLHPLYEPGDESDCAVPDFFPLRDKYMLLFASHSRGAQYYIGSYSDARFLPERHGRMNYTTWDISSSYEDLYVSGDLLAPHSLEDARGRRVMIGSILEGRTNEAQRAAGWTGIMSLPRVLDLTEDGELNIEPLPELELLRLERRRVGDVSVGDGSAILLDAGGKCLEIMAEFDLGHADRLGLVVLSSPDGSERTVVSYSPREGYLELDPKESSLSGDAIGRVVQRGPLVLADGEPLKLRVFVDRSVVEVFANGKQCLTKRVYPLRPDSISVGAFSEGGDTSLSSMDVWGMRPIWPTG